MLTATALGLYALGLPGHGAIEVLARAFFARQDTRTPVILGVCAMALNVLLATLLVGPAGLVDRHGHERQRLLRSAGPLRRPGCPPAGAADPGAGGLRGRTTLAGW